MSTDNSFIEDAQKRFNGIPRELMKKYCGMLGVEIKGNVSDDTMRLRLCTAVGQIAPESAATKSATVSPRPTEKPNVTTIGRWGGRCHDVSLFRPSGDTSPGIPLRWDEMLIYVPWGDSDAKGGLKRYTIPEPHAEILNNAVKRSFTLETQQRKDKSMYVERVETQEPSIPFQDHGLTPGTEHLPGSMLEWYQWEAERKGYFQNFKLSRLQTIWSELSGKPPVTRISQNQVSEWNRDKCLFEVLQFLGPAYLAVLDDSEIDESLEAAA